MRYFTDGRFQQQASFLRRQFLQDGDQSFGNVLSEGIVAQALTAINVCWVDRIYSPLVTLWMFLGQVLSADHSCRAAVARLIAHRLSQGQRPCSAETGAYCTTTHRQQLSLSGVGIGNPMPIAEGLAADGIALPTGQSLQPDASERTV